ncbi:MAG TPA: DUF4294 domain-containing protein [Sunxiuqinia sp.]|nr:DUF4294 domain-containing protein [Sunxiuqinia sp.]
MKLVYVILILILGLAKNSFAQARDSINVLNGVEEGGDTLPHQTLDPISVFPKPKFHSRREERRYWRLERKVKKVYPYAVAAGKLMEKYNDEYLAAKTDRERRKYVKQVEKELFARYGSELKKLSISEGRILIKLIDRQTGHTSYELIKDVKGGFTAFFWQGVARIFGNDLKAEYDPFMEDYLIEQIVRRIEAGTL